jgi:hypothetical protein
MDHALAALLTLLLDPRVPVVAAEMLPAAILVLVLIGAMAMPLIVRIVCKFAALAVRLIKVVAYFVIEQMMEAVLIALLGTAGVLGYMHGLLGF